MAEVSATRLYLGNLPRNATKADVESHFDQHGHGKIMEIKLMNGFGFIEYEDALDARDVVPEFHGSDFMGERLVVQFARGANGNKREGHQDYHKPVPRPRRTQYRMDLTGLPVETSWQDLKDFARSAGVDVVYSEVGRDRSAEGAGKGYVEYETAADLEKAVASLDGQDFKGQQVNCAANIQAEIPRGPPPPPPSRYRSRSPGMRRGGGGYGPPPNDYYDYRRGPPSRGGYSPRRDDYRRRTPPPRDYYDDRRAYGRSPPPPRMRGPPDDYPAPRGRPYPEDMYGPPPPRGGYDDPYANGYGDRRGGYGRPPSPPRGRRSPGYGGGYDRPRQYW